MQKIGKNIDQIRNNRGTVRKVCQECYQVTTKYPNNFRYSCFFCHTQQKICQNGFWFKPSLSVDKISQWLVGGKWVNQMQQNLQKNDCCISFESMQLIGIILIKSRFALIHRKEQETKMPEKWGNFENLEEKNIKINAWAQSLALW